MPATTFVPKIVTVFREGYGGAWFRADLVAGLTVAIVALPLAMALGIASGASPREGLVTAIIAGFLISALGGSRVQIGGPTGAFVVIVAGIIAVHGFSGLLLATLLAGIILIVAGYAGVGRLMRFVPMPVVTGFTSGIAVIIASAEVSDFLGPHAGAVPAHFFEKWAAYTRPLPPWTRPASALGAATLATIVALRRWAPRVPGYLVAIVGATLAARFLHLPVETVGDRFPGMPSGVPLPQMPHFTLAMFRDVLPAAFTVAFLAGIEALLSAVVADGMTGTKHDPDAELVALGIGNVLAPLFGGIAATGALARTATNIRAGARSPIAAIVHAFVILLAILVLAPLVAYVPMAALAGLLLLVAWNMSELNGFLGVVRVAPKSDVFVLLTCYALTVIFDMVVAVSVGVVLAAILFMRRMAELTESRILLEDHTESGELGMPPGVGLYEVHGPLFFGAA